MRIVCLGLNHRTAPIELREQLAFPTPPDCPPMAGAGDISEMVVLSTCNRLELYACVDTPGDAAAPLVRYLEETRGVPAADFAACAYHLEGREAAAHLCRVAAGLDSMILGEPQILGQVSAASEAALEQGAAGPVLSALFRTAARAGKRARTETRISRHPATVSSVAVKAAEARLGSLAEARVLVVGAGEMADLALENLRARGVRRLTVVNRTPERGQALATRWQAEALPLDLLTEALAAADIVIASTDAPHFIITPELTEPALAQRDGRPLLLVDIAVPRNVDPAVARLPHVYLFDIDDLQERLNGFMQERQQEVPQVEAIVAAEVIAFTDWLKSLEVVPLIAGLRAQAEAIRRAEVEKTLRHLPGLSESDRQRIEALSEALVNKLLHNPTRRLKAEAANGQAAEYAALVRALFALEP